MSSAPADLEQEAVPPRRVAIIGGGLAGLTAANRLLELADEAQRPIELTLFEASERLGGAIETVRTGDYLVERGADSFLAKPAIVALCERLGLSDDLLPTDQRFRGALVLRNGKPLPVPAGFNLLAPAKVWPIVTTPILSPAGKLRLLAEAVVPARKDRADESLASFARRRLGNEAFERLVQPLVAGIYTADPEKLSLAATLPRFVEMERQHGSLVRAMLSKRSAEDGETSASGARYSLFMGLREGMEQLFAQLRARIEARAAIRTQSRIVQLAREDDGWSIATENGAESKRFNAVILAIPAYRAAELLSHVDAELAGDLRTILYASSAIVVTGHKLDDVAHPLDAFGLVIPAIEKRGVLAISFASRKFPGRAPDGRVLLRTFVGGAMQPHVLDRSDDELVALVRRELAWLLGVSGHPDVAVVTRYPDAMPQYHVGHLELISKIEAATKRNTGLELTGSAYRGVGMPDVVADAERAAESVFGNT